ncbi:MAG: type VII secretion protein EssC [Lachnospiraceae bacterium]|nr:type VII secretion protein EssC [Lachnospiraceae bacterium]
MKNVLLYNTSTKIVIDKDNFIVGKSANNSDFVLDTSSAISRSHCRFVKYKDDKYCIEDLDSKNGTYLNGYQLQSGQLYEISEGDKLKLADIELDVAYEKKTVVEQYIFDKGKIRAQIWGENFSQDVVLNDLDSEGIMIGTYSDCQIRFLAEENMEQYCVRLMKSQDNSFSASCSTNIGFYINSSYYSNKTDLEPGMNIVVYSVADNRALFYISLELDFDLVGTDYDMVIELSNFRVCSIGGSVDCDIRIDDVVLGNDYIELTKQGFNKYEIKKNSITYGLKINGTMLYDDQVVLADNSFFELYGYSFCVEDEKLYTSKNASIITKLPHEVIKYTSNHISYPKYIRNVRQKYEYSDEDIEVLSPKPLKEEEEKNMLLVLMPVLLNMLIMVVLRGMIGGGGMFVLYCGATMLVSSTVTIITTVNEIKSRKKRERDRVENYLSYISDKENYIIDEREQEKIVLSHMNPSLLENVKGVEDFSNRLFEKDKLQPDYLSICIGRGVVASRRQIAYKKEEYVESEDLLADYPQVLSEKYEYQSDMPVLLDMKDINAVGCIGVKSKLYQMAKNIILQFATSHFYKELKLFLIIDEGDVSLFEWARWLQNTYNETSGMRNFMYDGESAKEALEFLYSEMSEREGAKREDREDYIVIVYQSKDIKSHPVSKFISKGKELGFRFIFFEEYEELLHYECEKRIFLHSNEYKGYIQDADDGSKVQDFEYEYISSTEAEKIALKLACVYVDDVGLEKSLTKNISLYELLGVRSPYEVELESNWSMAKIYETLQAPLGVKSGDEIVYLDLHEKAHGPHGLVAGTTGSGKSEIMQTYILSMATQYHPYEVGFVLIDFKGGGMANQFRDLPHLIGTITNMDGNEVDRSLKSIKAELIKRQETFARYEVNHIDDYIKLYKNGVADMAIPHIILIVDEFAELKSEHPEFMKELISAARIGRSLGLHLILATQKPAGVVNDQIWSNSKFKLCLKVQDKNDSNEVIKSPLAAEIKEPGRAYLQVGNNEIFQLFQSAYSGAPARVDSLDESRRYKLYDIKLSGKKEVIYEKKQKHNDDGETQLNAMINYIVEYCNSKGIAKLPDICLPPLKGKIPFTLDNFHNKGSDIVIPVGIVDDPSSQTQYIETLNLTQNNVFILGASQSGKTNLLQVILRGLTTMYSPKEACVYIIDCASMIMKNYNELGHVGGVVTANQDEKLKNLFRLLQQSISERRNILSDKGLSSYSAYREAGLTDLPQIVVMLDNWIAFRNYFPDYEDKFINICRDCTSVGISVIVTAGQANGSGYKLISNFSKRIALYCNDSGDYSYIFEGCRMKIDDIQGRSIVENKKKYYECQFYLAFDAEKEYERISVIKDYIDSINRKYGDEKAKLIPEIPNIVNEKYLYNQYEMSNLDAYEIPVGIRFDNIELATVNLLHTNLLGIVGGTKSGRNKYVNYALNRIISNGENAPVDLYVLDDVTGDLSSFKSCGMYSTDISDSARILDSMYKKVEGRQEKLRTDKQALNTEPLILFVINSNEALNSMTKDSEYLDKFKMMFAVMRQVKMCILATNVANTMVTIGAGELQKKLKESRKFIIFENIKDIKVTDIQPSLLREYKKDLESVDAYYINGAEFCKVRTVN